MTYPTVNGFSFCPPGTWTRSQLGCKEGPESPLKRLRSLRRAAREELVVKPGIGNAFKFPAIARRLLDAREALFGRVGPPARERDPPDGVPLPSRLGERSQNVDRDVHPGRVLHASSICEGIVTT